MSDKAQIILDVSKNAILTFMRTHSLQGWAPEEYWWFGLMHAWGFPRLFQDGQPITKSTLENALLELEVPEECIKQSGVHTKLTLDHIAFVYKEMQTKDGRATLKIAPHIKGESFNKCSHPFIIVFGSAYELAQYLIDVDKTIPSLQTACIQAYEEGTHEQRIRDSRLETTRAFLMDFFKGEIPSDIVDFEIADSTPGAVDLIRLTIHDPDTPFWRTRSFDFPFESRTLLNLEHVQTFVDDKNLQYGSLEIYDDDETSIKNPVVHYRPYESEAERLGLMDDEM